MFLYNEIKNLLDENIGNQSGGNIHGNVNGNGNGNMNHPNNKTNVLAFFIVLVIYLLVLVFFGQQLWNTHLTKLLVVNGANVIQKVEKSQLVSLFILCNMFRV